MHYAVCVVKESLLDNIKGLGSLQSARLVFVVSSEGAGVEVLGLMMIYSGRTTIRVSRSKLILLKCFQLKLSKISCLSRVLLCLKPANRVAYTFELNSLYSCL